MKKTNLTPASCWLGPAALLSIFLFNACAWSPSEIRYDGTTRAYTSSPDGVKSTTGQYDDATAHYTLRQGGSSAPRSDVIRTSSEPAEKQDGSVTMVIEVTDVLFEFDKWVIKEPYLPELDKWVDYFQKNPVVTANIYGHTDSTGSTAYNQKLSERRAQAVINYLNTRGVPSYQLTAKGFGESQPTASNKTEAGRQENRRVELNF